MADCPYCSKPIPDAISRTTECPSCGRPLHCCECCTFYSKDAHYGCRENIDEPVWDKKAANFCDWYRFNADTAHSKDGEDEKAAKAREALAKLFSI